MADRFGIRLDYQDSVRRFRRELDALSREVFPRAMATMINRSTAQVHSRLTAYTLTAINKPNNLTKKAWYYVKAKPEDGDRMWAEVRAREIQAQYLWFLVSGGTRKPGDVGTNRAARDIFSFTKKLSPGDGIDRRYIRQQMRKLKTENTKRAATKVKRAAVIAERLPAAEQKRKLARLKWSVVSRNAPGVFVGTIAGVKGLWQRPERYTARERQAVIDAARAGRPSPPGGRSSLPYTRPGSTAKLLVAMSRETRHRATFDYSGEVNTAYAAHMTQAAFDASLEYERRRHRMLNGL